MTDVYHFQRGSTPLLISVPHDGRAVPYEMDRRMTAAGKALPDTDWFVAKLYQFAAELGASLLVANFSRYVVDLNRSSDDAGLYPGQVKTGLCPEQMFSGEAIYADHGVTAEERAARVERYWQPYHDKVRDTLDALHAQFGYALLWDAHSIPSRVPRLFEGELPELNLGSNDDASCSVAAARAVMDVAEASDYTAVQNGRFKGGFITRHYGEPGRGYHALQLEIAQRAYMDEDAVRFDEEKAGRLRGTLTDMLNAYTDAST